MPRAPKPLRGSRFKKTGRKAFPKRTYRQSVVPLASRGYSFGSHERKYKDMTLATLPANTTGHFQLLNNMVPGTQYENRIGRKVQIKSIYVRGIIGHESSLTTISSPLNVSGMLLRMILFCDMQPNGAVPALTDILFEASACAQLNPNYRDRFKILTDKQWSCGRFSYDTTNGIGFADNCVWPVKKYRKCNIQTVYNSGAAGTIADISSGAVYALFVGSETAGTDTDGVFFGTIRIRFDDL